MRGNHNVRKSNEEAPWFKFSVLECCLGGKMKTDLMRGADKKDYASGGLLQKYYH